MVDFNELRITPDGQYLIIDVIVKSDSLYDNVYISRIDIDNQDTYINGGPSGEALYSEEIDSDTNLKHIRRTIQSVELNGKDLENNMFFVWITCKGDLSLSSEETFCAIPCDADRNPVVGTVMASYPYYEQAMSYLGDLSQNCTIPKDFIDFILRTKAMELAVKTGNYPEAIKYYNKFFKDGGMYSDQKGGCGCGAG